MAVDQPLMTAWLAARSLSRGLAPPVADSGGARVDTGAPDERARYVFAEPGEGLRALGAAIDRPFVALKLCGSAEELLALLPDRWEITSRSWVMGRDVSYLAPRSGEGGMGLPSGYTRTLERSDAVTSVRILDASGVVAATGFAVEQGGVFVYDRIRVEAFHQRRGLGRALMIALATARRDPASREILTATAEGRALYLTMGWRDLAPYSTAMIPPA